MAPVLDKDARSREVYLPGGIWYDFWTGRKITGGRTFTATAPLDTIPLYVREGSVIPMGECVQYTGERPETILNIHVYGEAPTSYILYEDDGVTYSYEKGMYVKTRLQISGNTCTAKVVEGDSSLIPAGREYRLIRHTGETLSSASLPFILSFDQDLNTDGTCKVHLTADTAQVQAIFAYEMEVPSGWLLSDAPCYFRKTPLNKGNKTLRGMVEFCWEFTPVRSLLPLRNTAKLDLHIKYNGTEASVEHEFTWGSGCVHRADVIGFFDDQNAADRMIMEQIETGDIRPYYERICADGVLSDTKDDGELSSGGGTADIMGDRVYWNRHVSYNCWGYLDLRPKAAIPMKNGRGTGYAKFRVYSPDPKECHIQFSSERYFALWVNGEQVLEKEGIQLTQTDDHIFVLKAGYNDCLIKCSVDYPKQMSGREIGFSLRFLDQDGKEPSGLLFE